jgi:hypothetical protein
VVLLIVACLFVCCWLSGVGCRVLTVDCRVSIVDGCNRFLVVWFRLRGVGSKLSDVGVVCRLLFYFPALICGENFLSFTWQLKLIFWRVVASLDSVSVLHRSRCWLSFRDKNRFVCD